MAGALPLFGAFVCAVRTRRQNTKFAILGDSCDMRGLCPIHLIHHSKFHTVCLHRQSWVTLYVKTFVNISFLGGALSVYLHVAQATPAPNVPNLFGIFERNIDQA